MDTFGLAVGYDAVPTDPRLRAAYDAGMKIGNTTSGLPAECPFSHDEGLAERFAWLSGFSVARLSTKPR